MPEFPLRLFDPVVTTANHAEGFRSPLCAVDDERARRLQVMQLVDETVLQRSRGWPQSLTSSRSSRL